MDDAALDALEATFAGGRASLAERVEATRAAAARAAGPADSAAVSEEPAVPAEGVWVRVRQPEDRGVLLCRAIGWERAASGGWAMRVDLPVWTGIAVPGGFEIDSTQMFQLVPAEALITIPEQDYSRLPRP